MSNVKYNTWGISYNLILYNLKPLRHSKATYHKSESIL